MGRIYLDELNCARSEVELDACPHSGIKTHNCGHAEDAGVICIGWFINIMCINLGGVQDMEFIHAH